MYIGWHDLTCNSHMEPRISRNTKWKVHLFLMRKTSLLLNKVNGKREKKPLLVARANVR